MKKSYCILVFFIGSLTSAQHTISGTFAPAEDYKWLIAYQLKPDTQEYVADTAVKNGEFILHLSANSEPGTYRLVYGIPQEEYYFDVIYNGKENIKLSFNAVKGISFISSQENQLFNTYFKDINLTERQIIRFYTESNTDVNAFEAILENARKTQASYEFRSEGLLVHHFIKANKPYLPSRYESVQDYVKHKKANYFKNIDFKNPVLQASGFLIDKLANYTFTALPLVQMTQTETEVAIQDNIKTVNEKLSGIDKNYKLQLFYSLWGKAVANGLNQTSDVIYDSFVKPLAKTLNNLEIIHNIEIYNRLRLGMTAPEIVWKDGATTKKLSELRGDKTYVIIFWSSTCSHCLRELPALEKRLKDDDSIKVIAVGLEDDDENWRKETTRLQGFEHVISLGKWESKYAKLYNIQSTPSYFILDKDKHIIAKLDNDREVIEFLETNQLNSIRKP